MFPCRFLFICFLVRAGFQAAGSLWVSSREFRFSGRFSISMASLIILDFRCSMLASTFVFSKSMLCSHVVPVMKFFRSSVQRFCVLLFVH